MSIPITNPRELETYMLGLLNDERQRAGLPRFRHYDPLMQMAREHSKGMMAGGYFDHRGLEQRALRHLRNYRSIGENVAFVPGFDGVCSIDERWVRNSMYGEEIIEIYTERQGFMEIRHKQRLHGSGGLMSSPGHRANILSPEFTHCGVGIAAGYGLSTGQRKYGMWLTQDFAGL